MEKSAIIVSTLKKDVAVEFLTEMTEKEYLIKYCKNEEDRKRGIKMNSILLDLFETKLFDCKYLKTKWL